MFIVIKTWLFYIETGFVTLKTLFSYKNKYVVYIKRFCFINARVYIKQKRATRAFYITTCLLI